MRYRIWRWSAMKQKWVVFGERTLLMDAQMVAVEAKLRFEGCCTAIEWLRSKTTGKPMELERIAR